MESIEKLRKFAEKAVYADNYIVGSTFDLNRIADEIEREIAERFMELPVDADGVPIHVGEEMASFDGCRFTVCALATANVHYWSWNSQGECSTRQYMPYQCHHVKPRTVEDVLTELVECAERPGAKLDRGDIEGFADEIRELIGGGE